MEGSNRGEGLCQAVRRLDTTEHLYLRVVWSAAQAETL
jgi:hypothetical protein